MNEGYFCNYTKLNLLSLLDVVKYTGLIFLTHIGKKGALLLVLILFNTMTTHPIRKRKDFKGFNKLCTMQFE